jgi:hypothetical protein
MAITADYCECHLLTALMTDAMHAFRTLPANNKEQEEENERKSFSKIKKLFDFR